MINKANLRYIMVDAAIAMAIFFVGFFSYPFVAAIGGELEIPFSAFSGRDVNAPSDFIQREDIFVYPDRIVIMVPGATISSYADTGSMRPVLDHNSNGIRVVPKSEDDINVGDIISFRRGNSLIVHRVIEKGTDNEGTYFITKGDNNAFHDGIVRMEDIETKTIAVIY
jgi:signal peptidase I